MDDLTLTVERKRTDRYRIEARTVFVVCKEREPVKEDDLSMSRRSVYLSGETWSKNDEEMCACDTLEGAQRAMKHYGERTW